MATTIRFIYGTEAQILALTADSTNWVEQAFYYPDDKPYFFQIRNGVMKKYSGDSTLSGVGCRINGQVIGGVKQWIRGDEVLNIPADWEYNVTVLKVNGTIVCDGIINMI